MSKNLKVVQTTARVLEILCRIVFVCSIIGAVGSMVGIITLSLLKTLGPSVVDRIESETGRTLLQIIGYCVIGFILSSVEIVVSKMHRDYFIMEQKAGTPFTPEGAAAFRTLGIFDVVVPISLAIVSAIVAAIFKCGRDLRLDFSIGMGIAMILLSYVFAYGAELQSSKAPEVEAPKAPKAPATKTATTKSAASKPAAPKTAKSTAPKAPKAPKTDAPEETK